MHGKLNGLELGPLFAEDKELKLQVAETSPPILLKMVELELIGSKQPPEPLSKILLLTTLELDLTLEMVEDS